MEKNKTILVDMSATILHHGHINLLKYAKSKGIVIVALASDEEIYKYKGYTPELLFKERKEILDSIIYVDKVIKSPWKIDQTFFNSTGADYLLHGSDNSNSIPNDKLIIVEKTPNISSHDIRKKGVASLILSYIFILRKKMFYFAKNIKF